MFTFLSSFSSINFDNVSLQNTFSAEDWITGSLLINRNELPSDFVPGGWSSTELDSQYTFYCARKKVRRLVKFRGENSLQNDCGATLAVYRYYRFAPGLGSYRLLFWGWPSL